MAERFTLKHSDEFERSGRWSLVRRRFSSSSREPALVIDGEEHRAPVGTYARLDPEPTRTVVNKGRTKARILIVSAPVSSGYAPPDWA